LAANGAGAVAHELDDLLDQHLTGKSIAGHIDFVSAEFADPELLTLKARKALDTADVVVFDEAVDVQLLELARREAVIIEAGQPQPAIDHAKNGAQVVRLKSAFGAGLNNEVIAVAEAGVAYRVIPCVSTGLHTAASKSNIQEEKAL
jgi:uroporphyrin-III C-methyltransferase/precorrin-2 dehydrogenase/sirohydrochlorin ferrochelatase